MSKVDVDFNGQQGENIQVDSCNFSSINNNSLDPKTFAESIVSTDGEENLRMVKFHQPRNSILNVLHRLI